MLKLAAQLRKYAAEATASEYLASYDPDHWLRIVQNSFLNTILERNPFDDCLLRLGFSLVITEYAVDSLLASDRPITEKIGLVGHIVELGAREFVSPKVTGDIKRHLTAAKSRGFFFTPVALAEEMATLAFQEASHASVLDPACGTGTLLAYCLLKSPSIKLVRGFELDELTQRIATKLLKAVCCEIGIAPVIDIRCDDFLDVFARGDLGMPQQASDLIIMNPPYGRARFLKTQLTNQETRSGLSIEEITSLSKVLRDNQLMFSASLRKKFEKSGLLMGTPEFSKLFFVASLQLVSKGGRIIAISPSSWLGDEASKKLRAHLISNHGLEAVWNFKESAKLFSGVNQPTAIVSIRVGEAVPRTELQSGLDSISSLHSNIYTLDMKDIRSYSPNWFRIPYAFNNPGVILQRIHQHKSLFEHSFLSNWRGELDLTTHKSYIRNVSGFSRLIRGDHIGKNKLLPPEESSKAGFVDKTAFLKKISGSKKVAHIDKPRIAMPQCSYMQKAKRLEACVVPQGSIIGNSCNYIIWDGDPAQCEQMIRAYCVLLNSAVLEWRFRLFNSNNHVSNYELDELPMLDFEDRSNPYITQVFELICGPNAASNGEIEHRIEALIALAYGLGEEELRAILKDLSHPEADAILAHLHELLVPQDPNGSRPKVMTVPIVHNHSVSSLSALDLEMIRHVKPGGNWQDIPESVPSQRLAQIRAMSKERGIVRTTYYGRLRPDQPAYTIATYFNRPGNGTNIHPWEHRTLTVREAARLQSFPDEFVFHGNERAVRKQVGNAVPPLLGYALGKALGPQTFVDLFAGAGGLSYGLMMAGLTGICGQELDKYAAATYVHNHPGIPMIEGDINNQEIQAKLIEVVQERLAGNPLGLLAGGPPCQGFSTAGWREHDDKRNALVATFLRIAEALRPNYILLENVEGLLSMAGGAVVRGIQEILSELEYDYYTSPWTLNVEEFGVPQMRRRVVIVAAKRGIPLPTAPMPYFDKCLGRREKLQNRNSDRYPITVAEALLGLPSLTPIIEDFVPDEDVPSSTYSLWCSGRIKAQEFLEQRGRCSLTSPKQLQLSTVP